MRFVGNNTLITYICCQNAICLVLLHKISLAYLYTAESLQPSKHKYKNTYTLQCFPQYKITRHSKLNRCLKLIYKNVCKLVLHFHMLETAKVSYTPMNGT